MRISRKLIATTLIASSMVFVGIIGMAPRAYAASIQQCGAGDTAYTPVIEIGCKGKGNAIMDALFGIIHFLSLGVGLVVIGSVIVGAIQYSASRGDPQATAQAVNRIRSALMALLIYIFAYAILNYLLPGFIL